MPLWDTTSASAVQWVAIFADAAAKGMVVLLIAAVATLLLRRSSAAVRHMVWAMALACLIAMPLLSFVLPQLQVPLLPERLGRRVVAPAARPAPVALPPYRQFPALLRRIRPKALLSRPPCRPGRWLCLLWKLPRPTRRPPQEPQPPRSRRFTGRCGCCWCGRLARALSCSHFC